MTYETLEFDITDGLATIMLNRPDAANALNRQMAYELFDVAVRCGADHSLRAVLWSAHGKMFCGGGDLEEMKLNTDELERHLLEMATILHQGMIRLANLDAPVVIAVNGAAGGGGFSMALSGDYVIASEKAKFVSGYTASGLTPDGTSTHFLAKHVGLLRAKELFLTNRTLSAQEAMDWGIVNRVVAHDDLMSEARAMADRFAAGPTKAFGGTKRLLQTTYSDPMESQVEKETQGISGIMNTRDAPHGIASFLAKERPKFEGR
ncbi:MAG: enoyl-CoA hydratase/isomerase family protein [Paracoccaceae bacterium]